MSSQKIYFVEDNNLFESHLDCIENKLVTNKIQSNILYTSQHKYGKRYQIDSHNTIHEINDDAELSFKYPLCDINVKKIYRVENVGEILIHRKYDNWTMLYIDGIYTWVMIPCIENCEILYIQGKIMFSLCEGILFRTNLLTREVTQMIVKFCVFDTDRFCHTGFMVGEKCHVAKYKITDEAELDFESSSVIEYNDKYEQHGSKYFTILHDEDDYVLFVYNHLKNKISKLEPHGWWEEHNGCLYGDEYIEGIVYQSIKMINMRDE